MEDKGIFVSKLEQAKNQSLEAMRWGISLEQA